MKMFREKRLIYNRVPNSDGSEAASRMDTAPARPAVNVDQPKPSEGWQIKALGRMIEVIGLRANEVIEDSSAATSFASKYPQIAAKMSAQLRSSHPNASDEQINAATERNLITYFRINLQKEITKASKKIKSEASLAELEIESRCTASISSVEDYDKILRKITAIVTKDEGQKLKQTAGEIDEITRAIQEEIDSHKRDPYAIRLKIVTTRLDKLKVAKSLLTPSTISEGDNSESIYKMLAKNVKQRLPDIFNQTPNEDTKIRDKLGLLINAFDSMPHPLNNPIFFEICEYIEKKMAVANNDDPEINMAA